MKTRLTELLEIEIPILNGPMTPQAGGALAGAVSEAGAFGMLGFDEDEPIESLRAQVALARGAGRSFGIGLVIWVLEKRPELLALAIESKPKLVSISFGDPAAYVERFHQAGILVASQVQSKAWAEVAQRAGVDLIVAQGGEAGGHTGSVATLPLLQVVLESGQLPVIAAGGIATGRGLAAVLAAGAVGGWIGTPFLVADESRTTAGARRRVLESDETQTLLTSVFDRVQHKPWPREFRGRVLRNQFVDEWNEREDAMMTDPSAEQEFRAAKAAGDYAIANVYAGQSVGLVHRATGAAEIVRRIADEAETRLRELRSVSE